MIKKAVPITLLIIYLAEVLILGIAPADRTVWLSENIVAWIPAVFLVFMYYRGIRFSGMAYFSMWLWFVLHTIGGHFTFAEVPFDFVTETCGFERNHFDRVCHFLVGGFAYPAMEALEKYDFVKNRIVAFTVTVMAVFGFAGIFEIIEWLYAVWSSPEAGTAFLGSQGDVWDAQKDILADGTGAILFATIYCIKEPISKVLKIVKEPSL